MQKPTETEAERARGEVVRARRSLLIIFGVGGVGAAIVIAYILRHMPEGSPDLGAAPLPGVAPYGATRGPVPCKKFGDSCEFRPGQLGACVQRENCSGNNCLFCQSQH